MSHSKIHFWQMFGFRRKATVAERVAQIRSFLKSRDFLKAEETCLQSLINYPNEERLLSVSAEISVRERNWPSAITRLEHLLVLQGTSPRRDKTVLRLTQVFVGMGQLAEADVTIAEGLAIRPNSLALRYAAAKLAMLHPNGLKNATVWQDLAATPKLRRQKDSVRIPIISTCVAGLRLVGLPYEAQALLSEHFNSEDSAWIEYAEEGYGRLIVFDNGKTRVEFHTKIFDDSCHLIEARRLVITFDILTRTWNRKPYTYKALSRLDNDFLAIRKATRLDSHQDFRREDFLQIAESVSNKYPDVVVFGHSLGAYCALYYGTTLPLCRILVTAPRNSKNPKYWKKKRAVGTTFLHEHDMPGNPLASPTIVFDPKNIEDCRYVQESLRPAFPNARFVIYPYTGHSITRYLLEVGILKSTTIGFCEGIPFPKFDRRLRGQSAEYLRNLASRNFSVGRKKWALALALRAKELGTYPGLTKALIDKLTNSDLSE